MTTSTAGLSFAYVSAAEVIALGAVLPAVCILIVGARFYVTITQKSRVPADGWLILAALLMIVGMGICFIIGARKGVMGYPTPAPPDLPDEELLAHIDPSTQQLEKIEFAFQLLMIMAYGFVKLSIVFFCRRLFVVAKRGAFHIVTITGAIVISLWTVAFMGLFLFNCGTHISAQWGSLLDLTERCRFTFTSEEGLCASDLILDLFVFLLPFPVIWRLQMTNARKIAVSGVFLIGAAALAASVVRLVIYVQVLENEHKLPTASDKVVLDENLVITVALYWSLLESGLALIAACLPSLSVLVRQKSFVVFISNLRSKLSLLSLHSHPSLDSRPEPPPKDTVYRYGSANHESSASDHDLAPSFDSGSETKVASDVEKGYNCNHVGPVIHVKNEMLQEKTFI